MLRFFEYLFKVSLLTAIYFFSGQLSFAIAQENLIVTIVIFFAEGFALAALILFGRQLWPGVFLGQLALAWQFGLAFWPAMGIALGNAFEAWLGATLFYRIGLSPSLSSLKEVFRLLALIALVLQPLSAGLGHLVLWSQGLLDTQELPSSMLSWWFGNTLGQFLITPTVLLVFSHFRAIQWFELLSSILCVFLVSIIVFYFYPVERLSLLFIITLPMILWISIYWGRVYGSIAMLINSIMAVVATKAGLGAFALDARVDSLIDLNFYVLSQVLLVLFVGTLFHEKNTLEHKLKAMALYDALTGLPSRHLLKEKVLQGIMLAQRYKKRTAILCIDIDDFKRINDIYGHSAGDRVIVLVVRRISRILKTTDALLRFGGDEFLLVLTDVSTKKDIEQFIERLFALMETPLEVGEGEHTREIQVSLNIGISVCPDDGNSIYELVAYADMAMYRVKHAKGHAYAFYGKQPIQSLYRHARRLHA